MPTCKPLSTIGSTSSTFFLRGSEQPSATIASTAMLAARVHTSGEAQAPLEKTSSCAELRCQGGHMSAYMRSGVKKIVSAGFWRFWGSLPVPRGFELLLAPAWVSVLN